MQHETNPIKAGFSIAEWCPAAGISRATFYALPPDAKPTRVGIGTRTVIKESPAEWLDRMEQGGGVTIPRRKKKGTARVEVA